MKINKDQISLSSPLDNIRFHLYRGRGHFLRYILNRFRWYYYPRLRLVTSFPEHVDIELSSACNMKCPMCYTTTEQFKREVPRRNMSWDLLAKIIEECGREGAFSIRLSWRGEPLLNKHTLDAIKLAKKHGIKEVSTLTNALLLTPELFKELALAGLDWLTISVDGVGVTYNEIRKPAKFEDLLVKLNAFKQIKKELGLVKPVIKVQTIWPAIADNPSIYFDTFKPLVDQVMCNQLVDYLQQDQEISFESDFECPVLYQRLTIGSDGRILMCYNDEFSKHIFGDLTKNDSIKSVWHGEMMRSARSAHLAHRGAEQFYACSRCFLPREYESMKTINVDGRDVKVDGLKGRKQVVGK